MKSHFTQEDVLKIFEKHGLSPKGIAKAAYEGVVNEVWFADDLVIRINKNLDFESDVWTETVAVPALTAKNILTPELLVFDADLDIVPRLVTIYRRVPGISLSRVEYLPNPEEFFFDLGRAIRAFHDSIAEVDDPNNRLDPAWFVDVEKLKESLDSQEIRENMIVRPDSPHVFCHQDLHADNIVVHEGKLAAIIDWGDAGWGPRGTDFRFVPARFFRFALEGYGEMSYPDKQFVLTHQVDQYLYATRENRSYGTYGDSTWEDVLGLFHNV